MIWVLVLLIVASGALCAWWLYERRKRETVSQPQPLRAPVSESLSPLSAREPDKPLVVPRFNPLEGLPFEDALDGEKFALHVHESTERALAASVKRSGFQFGNLSLQVFSATRQGFQVTFEKGTAEFVRTADGVFKAQTRGPSGAFQEIGNIDQLGTWANRAANVTAITVAVANLISNADSSKKLGKLLEGQDKFFAYRAIDHFATVKTAYEDLREELGTESPNQQTLNKLRSRIRKVRHTLMLEAKHDLEKLQLLYPDRDGFMAGTRKLAGDWYTRKLTGAEQERAEALNQYRGKLLLARHCVSFENIAATVAGSSEQQEQLLVEARDELSSMLPQYQRLEQELGQSADVQQLLARLFGLEEASVEATR